MKLVEILARELSEWPDCVVSMSQDSDLQVSHYESTDQVGSTRYGRWDNSGYIPCSRFTVSGLATDYATSIVTREMWEAEKCKLRSVEDTTALLDALEALPGEDYKGYNPIQSRDRIYEIDTLVESLEEERAALVQGLEDEGFKLVGKGVKGDCVEPAMDISDWRDWKAGDKLVVSNYLGSFTTTFKVGEIVTVFLIRDDGVEVATDDELDYGWYFSENEVLSDLKFHSRPKV